MTPELDDHFEALRIHIREKSLAIDRHNEGVAKMKKRQSFEETMLEKYPNLYTIGSCHQCKADLRYLKRIHRINYNWYCDVCYEKKQGKSTAQLIKYGRIKGLKRAIDAINLKINELEVE